MTPRGKELADRLALVRQGLARSCEDAGRDPLGVTLIAVSKGWGVEDIAVLADLGVADFAENRVDELVRKAEALRSRAVRWHFVGQLQSKKAGAVARVAQVVHSVDREKVIRPLASQGRGLDVFIQVSLDGSADDVHGRGGAMPGEVDRLAAGIEAEPALNLRGVMTLPPRDVEPSVAFRRLAEISAELRRSHPRATAVSAGMSGDFPAAIAAGATHVRIGSALFGDRTGVR